MKLTDKEIQLLAQLSRDRGLYAECKGVTSSTHCKRLAYCSGLTRVRR